MSDQHTPTDPRTRYDEPDTEGRTIPHPGRTRQMDDQPDHGEQTYRGSGRLQGRRAVVTGGDSGIGRAVAIAFAREGADVLITHLEAEAEDARETARWVEEAGRTAVTVAADLREEAQCRRVVETAVAELGGIDVLVNNAAYQVSQPDGIEGISTDQLDRTLKTNLYAMFWPCQAALPHLEPGASIINTSSVQAFKPSYHLLDHAMTKGAIVNFTKGLAEGLVDKGIRVNSVAPGPIRTPLIPATMDEEKVESFGEQAPLGRAGQPAELAPAYVFFASQESSYVTAETLAVTGGTPVT